MPSSVLSPWAAELLASAPPSSLLAPGPAAPSPAVGAPGPIGPHVDFQSMVAQLGRQRAAQSDPRLSGILEAISGALADRRGAGRETRGAPLGTLAGLSGDAATETPSPAPDDYAQPPTAGGAPRVAAGATADLPPDFNYDDYVKFVSGLESGGSYTIPNQAGSGAYGRFQFMPKTLDGMGIDKEEFKRSPALQDAAMKAFTQQNYQALQLATGMDKLDAPSMYLAHWFGPQGATQVLFSSPMTRVEKIFPKSWVDQNNLAGLTTGDIINRVYRKYQLHARKRGSSPDGG